MDKMKSPLVRFRYAEYARLFAVGLFKTAAMLVALYFFICSLTFLSTSFRILGGRNLGSLFTDDSLLANPVVGLMIGILVTVLVQSSATSTSIIVSLVSAGAGVRPAVPMIFGSNIGTSVTNTIVSMTQAGDRETFRRAFAAATVHDMFNWLTVIVMMVLECSTGFLETVTFHIVDAMPLGDANSTSAGGESSNPDLLKPLTKPLTNLIVQMDKKVLLGWSLNDPQYENVTSMLKTGAKNNLFSLLGEQGLGLTDTVLGILLLVFSLSLLVGCLLALMNILKSVLGTKMAVLIQQTINADIPYMPWLTGYIAMAIGAVITFLVRSSSIFTSTLTPLCGAGLITLETAYPMTLGSNIGTTSTAILASLAADSQHIKASVQIAFVHLFFNVIGILIFYPIPCMRWPIPLARRLGDITAKYRWFAAFYLISSFFLLPVSVFLLSLAGITAMYATIATFGSVAAIVGLINLIQSHRSHWLPSGLRNWHFLPLWMRSLEPLDHVVAAIPCAKSCRNSDCCEGVEGQNTPRVNDLEMGDTEEMMEALVDKMANGHGPIVKSGGAEAKANGDLFNPVFVQYPEKTVLVEKEDGV
jgi:sodium-dependent phosphate cotransporter